MTGRAGDDEANFQQGLEHPALRHGHRLAADHQLDLSADEVQ